MRKPWDYNTHTYKYLLKTIDSQTFDVPKNRKKLRV